jgi:signal transduction histidine kinase
MYQAQQDTLSELTDISASINRATDLHFIDEYFQQGASSGDKLKIDSLSKRRKLRALPPSPKQEFFNWKIEQAVDEAKRSDSDVIIEKRYENEVEITINNGKQKEKRTSAFSPNVKQLITCRDWITQDSMAVFLKEVEVNLKQPLSEARDSLIFVRSGEDRVIRTRKAPSFNFVIPDFSQPHEPRLVKYKYNTADFQTALDKMRNRNMLITLSIFLISIGALMIVTMRFLKPISALKKSFDDVVEGNLEASVPPTTKDEIGDLTRAFNNMVDELKKNKEKEALLQRKERLASLGQLAAGVAHEIKNPLNAINLTIGRLNDKHISTENQQARGYIDTVQNEIRRLDKIVNNFLNYVRSEELHKQAVDVNNLLSEVLILYSREMSAAGIELNFKRDLPYPAAVDPERLKTAFGDLILNAIQSMPQGGLLTVGCDPVKEIIEICDTGYGMSPESLHQVFDLFYTTKTNGTGLGLPTADKIIKEHDGELELKSQPEKGTSVLIHLPVSESEEVQGS